MSSASTPAGGTPPAPTTSRYGRQQLHAAIASIVGTTIEWYDYFLYGAVAALVFNKVFFTNLNPVTGTIAAFGTFAVGFLARPIGAAVFGELGDKRGRKSALLLTLLVMGVSTVAIGLLPTYNQIGLWAPALLILVRIGQGFAAGGEWGGAVLLTFENSGGVRRGLMASLPGIGIGIGSLLSTGIVALLTATMSAASFAAWGWRIPFLVSAVIVLFGVMIRMTLDETDEFERAKAAGELEAAAKSSVLDVVRGNWRELLIVIGARIGENGCYYLFGTFVVAYAAIAKISAPTVLFAVSVAFAIEIVAIPFFGWVSDWVGRRTVYGFGAGVLTCWGWVFFHLLDTGTPALIFLAVIVGIVFAHSAMFGAQSAFFAELFGVKVRYSGLALGHSIGAIIGGGIAPLIATALLKANGGAALLVSAYASAMGVVTIITLLASRRYAARSDTARQDADGPAVHA